jgi:hypothetical protein
MNERDDVDGKCTCTEHASDFEWVFEVAYSGFSEEVDGARFGVADFLDTHERAGAVREMKVEVHEIHHGDTHVRGAELLE